MGEWMADGKQKEVLLICQTAQDGRNLTFLMKLGGYGYRLAGDVMEGVNYLHNCRTNGFPLHLILTDSAAMAAGDGRELLMLQEIRRQTPLLIIDRGNDDRNALLGRLQASRDGIYFCEPEEVVGTVERLLQQSHQGSGQLSAHSA